MNFPRMALAASLVAVAFAANAQQAERKTYIVQLADAPVASYTGNVSGLAATKPAAGRKLDVSAANVQAYIGFLDTQRSNVLASMGTVKVVHKYNLAFNGFSAQLTEAQARKLKSSAGVVAVSADEVRKLDTNSTPEFLGLTAPGGLWSQTDALGRNVKGEDVIIGILDSGVWPEDPSFGDKQSGGKPVAYYQSGTQVYGPPPAKWKGVCQTGGGFTTAMCNNKLIGARYFVDGFNAAGSVLTSLEFVSPRDGDGHGSHTASTAGGNSGSEVIISGQAMTISGMAPRARIAAYKICWEATVAARTGCYNSDSVKAIDQAVADGVDVLNFSVSGTTTNYLDPVEVAFFNASAAGVFVATSAGNAGPANTVAHPSPWLTTVAASTDNKLQGANVVTGSGASYSGYASAPYAPVPSSPLIDSAAAGKAGVPVANATLCFLGSLDPAKVAGKIVVCTRGTNDRVEKSLEVKNAGGVGMVLADPPGASGPVTDPHSVPTVHLPSFQYAAIRAYAATNGATASLSASFSAPAPAMAGFSSRGPSLANGNVLKPDITAPGVAINAAYVAPLTQSERDQVNANTLTPPAGANTLSGTSMASPHVAGVGALMKQLFPTWTPYAIKSALMTSAGEVKLGIETPTPGAPDPFRFGYGSGQLNPNGAAAQALVYDTTPVDYLRFLCGAGVYCTVYGSVLPWDLNLASMTASSVVGKLTFNRKVKNVTTATQTYTASASLPGYAVDVVPSSLTIAPGATASFKVNLTRTSAPLGTYMFGNVVWSNGSSSVTSPLTARGSAFLAPAELVDARAVGTKPFTVTTGFDGSLNATATGLVPAGRKTSVVAQDAAKCYAYAVPAGAVVARFQTFNSETTGGASTDLDMEVYNGSGVFVGGSGGSSSDEIVTLKSPAPGNYTVCIIGYSVPDGGATFTLNRWIVGPAVGTQTLQAASPSAVATGATASIGLGWKVQAGRRYLGTVQFTDGGGAALGTTLVTVNAL